MADRRHDDVIRQRLKIRNGFTVDFRVGDNGGDIVARIYAAVIAERRETSVEARNNFQDGFGMKNACESAGSTTPYFAPPWASSFICFLNSMRAMVRL